jgi:hypothetical protein
MKSVATLLLFGLTALAQDDPRVLEGSVVNSVTGLGIDGAKITLLGGGKGGIKNSDSVTDATGNFHISGLAPGNYQVFVQKSGFSSPPPVPPNPSASSLHIDAATNPPRLRLALIPPATLRGRVFGADGEPAVKVRVTLGPQYEKKTITDDDGAFVFENVPPGQASLAAFDEHVRTYFPATTDPAFAESIPVRPGEDQGGYEIRLQTADVYRVRGIVLNAAGKPSVNSIVSLLPDLPGAFATQFVLSLAGTTIFSLNRSAGVPPAREPDVVSGKDGAFEFSSVPGGDWILRAEAENIDRGVSLVGVRKDIDDVRIRLEAPLEILGSVALGDGSPAPAKTFINLMLTSTDGMRKASSTVSDKNRSLRIEDVSPGRYRITATAISAGYYVASVMVGDVDALRQPALLSDSSPPLRIVLKAGGRLSGNVDKGEGAKLLLVPQTFASGDVGRVYPCGAGGNFELAGIPPGDYYAIAVTQFRAGSDALRAITRDATPVRLEEGAVTSVQLKAPVDLP